ncbi:glycine betaine ABC transporter substrate-binding protein [Virgibacillus sp. JSM 102003]|uniref:glycine betaine ABC transporter substrate-binding protein n=1 Tax=Virgibacillus sp. JSM 102003 TaxID=1562108 RepID=UPI0035BFCC15
MKKILLSSLTALLLLMVVGCSSDSSSEASADDQNTEGNETKQTITFGVTPWTSTVPPTEIARIIIEDMGYKVEETQADAGSVYVGLSRGDIDVFMDSWLPAHNVYLEKYSENISDTAVSYDNADAGWVVPKYMEDVNSIGDLKGKEDSFNNEMYAIEEGASATKIIDEAIKGYGLDMKQINSSEGGMMAQAMRKMQSKEPVVFYGWRPHTMFNKFDIKMLKDPKGFFDTASVHVITNNQLKEDAPDAYKFLSNWSIPIDDVETMIGKIEDEGMKPEKVAQNWIDNNQDKVNKMLGK